MEPGLEELKQLYQMNNLQELKEALDKFNSTSKFDEPLAKFTTWRIGGPADLFFQANSTKDLTLAVKKAMELQIPYTILGWGSNVLISDKGIRGLVIKNASRDIEIKGKSDIQFTSIQEIEARLSAVDKEKYYNFEDLDFDESHFPPIELTVASGVYLPYLINVTIDKGITGLQWFAGIPGTIGGAVYNNIHGGSRFFSEVVKSVNVLTEKGDFQSLPNNILKFDYDYSIFHENKDVILSVDLVLREGEKERARNTSIAWATRKRLQPANSAGCCFQNIDKPTQTRLNLESNSWGYIIDKVLGLKGKEIGKAKISEKHAAFIETQPGASSSDVLNLFDTIYETSNKRLGITPKTEIFFIGFDHSEINKYIQSTSTN